jgi:hypothetical protein
MELKDLIGLHQLGGVDMSSDPLSKWSGRERDDYEQCEVINFVLDGKTYTAIQDPDDGYRSHMREIMISDYHVSNVFPPIQVLGIMRESYRGDEHDIIDFYDTKNAKLVLSVGTKYTNDYYPSWVAEFNPVNMSINDDR